jgi:Phosphotransferase enzyme family
VQRCRRVARPPEAWLTRSFGRVRSWFVWESMDQATEGPTPGVFAAASDPVQMKPILEQHLLAPGGLPFEVVSCKPSFTRGRGPRSLFQYDVTLRDADGREWREAVSGVAYSKQRTQNVWEGLKLDDAEARGEPKIRRAAYVPELDLLLQVFPVDHRLPALEPLMAGPLVGLHAPIMARFGPGDWRLDEWESEPVRYRVDLRASVKLTVRATDLRSDRMEERRFFAKVYADEDQVERAWTVQRDLAAALQAANEPFGLAPLVAYLPGARVLVQDEVQALSLRKIVKSADPEVITEALRRAGRAIAALHRLPFNAPEHRLGFDRLDRGRLRRCVETLRNSRPDLATELAEIEARICSALDIVGELPPVPVHGDLKPLHFLVEVDRVVLLDLDKFAAGDPMLDVTKVLVPLHRERDSCLPGSSLARVFAEEYFAQVPAEWEQRLAPHYAWAILRAASSAETGPRKTSDGARPRASEKRERGVEILVEEARAMLANRA